MPEGDTIHKTAASLHRALPGRRLIGFRTTGGASGPARRRPEPGTVVEVLDAIRGLLETASWMLRAKAVRRCPAYQAPGSARTAS